MSFSDRVAEVGQMASHFDDVETREWLESLDYVIEAGGPERVRELLRQLEIRAAKKGVEIPFSPNTPYINTIPASQQPDFPGNRAIERRIKSLIRWNAMAMVVRANREETGIGGHISTYASAATLYEVAFNHFLRGKNAPGGGDHVYFQGHAAPGIYARAYLEGRLQKADLRNFRRELKPGGGLSSYPHPWLMPDFWEFPTVSMGLGPILAIYQARFNRYLEDRGFKKTSGSRVWAFLGDGETDEPETLGSISLAAREKLDNLVFVINCNLQRLDGPVRGNGKIIQELERGFRGAGWNVIKVIWGSAWDGILEMDETGALVEKMSRTVDGDWQKYSVDGVEAFVEDFFSGNSDLEKIRARITPDRAASLRRGGHDPEKIFAAYQSAVDHRGSPTVILAKTVKGYGLGEAGEGKNITHQQKKLNEAELRCFRARFEIPLSDDEVTDAPFFRPPQDSSETIYLQQRRKELGGPLPCRVNRAEPLPLPSESLFDEFKSGTKNRPVSTTMAFVRILSKLLRDKKLGARIVPIIPDEARTFGMEALFSEHGIYSHVGQLYEPVDAGSLMFYREAQDGQVLEEGITEAGALSSFIAAGTAYSNHSLYLIPFFIYYSMFGFQRIGDLIWAAGDMRCRGFLVGGTAGRTTLAGEGLQHQDGHSHLLAFPVPNLKAYDPAFAFELSVIIRDGMKRMYQENEDVFYYLTVENENYPMPSMPEGVEEGILRGLYRFRPSATPDAKLKAHLLASGAIVNEALKAQEALQEYGVAADVWSVTSFKELYRDATEVERWNLLNPSRKPRVPYLSRKFSRTQGVFVVASDYVKVLPNLLSRWLPRKPVCLGTDGFGRSESRASLRNFFEVDWRFITLAALQDLYRQRKIRLSVVKKAIASLGIDQDKVDPSIS